MIPISFDESNEVLNGTTKLSEGDICECLSILRSETTNGTLCIVSCWKLTTEELAEVIKTGRVWLTVCGSKMPPVTLSGTKPF